MFVTSGCSDALRIAMDCLGSEKRNILLPKPGFSLYQTIAGNRGIPVKFYDLDVGIYIVFKVPFGLGMAYMSSKSKFDDYRFCQSVSACLLNTVLSFPRFPYL